MELPFARTALPRRGLFLGSILALALAALSCGDNGTGPTPQPQSPDSAVAYVQRAYAALENTLYDLINSDPQYPRDADFTAANDLYRRALAFDDANVHAHFGTGLTGLLVLTTDEEVNAAFDEWKQYLDAHTPFEVPGSGGRALGVPLGMPAGGTGLRMPFDIVSMTIVAVGRSSIQRADPQIGRVQDILRTRALPRLATALVHLQRVAQDPAFVFRVSPRMQGDAMEPWRELDLTDVLAMRAGCSVLAAACRAAISYNLGFAAYDSLNLVRSLTRGSGWLTLASDGAAQLRAARTSLLDATDDVERAVAALLAETDDPTDPQDDDIIKIDPGDLPRADVDSIQANLPNVRRTLTTSYTHVDDWDGDSTTPDVPLTIAAGSWFTNPVRDWKEFLPAYTVSTERRPHNEGPVSPVPLVGAVSVPVNFPGPGSSSGTYTISHGGDGGAEDHYFTGDEFLREPLRQACRAGLDHVRTLGGCLGWANVSSHYSATSSSSGWRTVTLPWESIHSFAEVCVIVPVITWDAPTFDVWLFPDPTFGGLLPQMMTTSQLFSTFGVTEDGWERRWVIDWTN